MYTTFEAIEFGEIGVSFSFTVWTLVSWSLLCVLIYMVATLIKSLRRNDVDMEAMLAILTTLANEQSGLKIPETRQALREEIQRRGWEK